MRAGRGERLTAGDQPARDARSSIAGLRVLRLAVPAGNSPAGRWHIHFARVAVIVLVGFFSYFAVRVAVKTELPPRGDFGVYYRAGQDMAARRPLYYTDIGIEETFKYAPAEALALTAIQWLPPRIARLCWYLIDVLLLGVIFAVSYRLLYPDGKLEAHRLWLALAAFMASVVYIINQLGAGQTTTLWVALCMLTFYWSTQGKAGRAGVGLAAAVCVKVVPLCFVPQLLLRSADWPVARRLLVAWRPCSLLRRCGSAGTPICGWSTTGSRTSMAR